MWMVRAGEGGSLISEFITNNLIAIGWHEFGDLTSFDKYSKIKSAVRATYPDYKDGAVSISASQLKKYRMDFDIGDNVVTYDPSKRIYHVGKIVSDYKFDTSIKEYPHVRIVEWIGSVSRDDLSTSTKNTLGGISTLFEIGEDSKNEILSKIQGIEKDEEETAAEKEEMDQIKLDIVNRSHEFIKDKLLALHWEEMQELVAGLLRGMGYRTIVSAPGPDRGRDIIASPDGLGLKDPKIIVEVKHRSGSMGAHEVRSFTGGLRPADKGLYVSTGGFTKEAKYEADRSNIPITLMDADQLVGMIIQYYDQFDNEARSLIPLTKIFWPA